MPRFNQILPNFGDRSAAETLLGLECDFRPTQSRLNVSRGIAETRFGDDHIVCTAYSIDNGRFSSGVLVDPTDGSPKLILTPGDTFLDQAELAAAIDFWEKDSPGRIFCLHERSCGAVLFTGDGDSRRFLLVRMNLGHCGLPKGHIEKFETEEQTALREIKEETGVSATLIPGFHGIVEYPISVRSRKTSVYFIAKFVDTDIHIQESEIKSYKLCNFDEAIKFITHANDRAVFVEAVRYMRQHPDLFV